MPDFGALQPTQKRQLSNFDAAALLQRDNTGAEFDGYFNAAADGVYTFWLTDDSGAHLWLNDAHVIDDDFNHTGQPAYGWISLKAGLHPLRLAYRHAKGTPQLTFEFAGPMSSRSPVLSSDIAADAASIVPTTQPDLSHR